MSSIFQFSCLSQTLSMGFGEVFRIQLGPVLPSLVMPLGAPAPIQPCPCPSWQICASEITHRGTTHMQQKSPVLSVQVWWVLTNVSIVKPPLASWRECFIAAEKSLHPAGVSDVLSLRRVVCGLCDTTLVGFLLRPLSRLLFEHRAPGGLCLHMGTGAVPWEALWTTPFIC